MDFDDFYTKPKDAAKILKERINNKELVKKVNDFINRNFQPFCQGSIQRKVKNLGNIIIWINSKLCC